jgi:hypothetical protein
METNKIYSSKNYYFNSELTPIELVKEAAEKEVGKYKIHSIQDWGSSLIVSLDNITDPRYNDVIKIYVDKDLFKSQFPEGSTVTVMRLLPEAGAEEYLINDLTLEKSQSYYPWDPV